MATTTFSGLARSYGGRRKGIVTPGVLVQSVLCSGDPTETTFTADAGRMRVGTSATVGELFILPKGAIPLFLCSYGGTTGGSSPTVDIGGYEVGDITSGADGAGYFNEVDADTIILNHPPNQSLDVITGTPTDTQVTCRVGASAGTGGTFTGVFAYTMFDLGRAGESEPALA